MRMNDFFLPLTTIFTCAIIGMMVLDRYTQHLGISLGLRFSASFLSIIVLSIICHAIFVLGFWQAFIFLSICACVPYIIEIIGVHTGYPFGKYVYGTAIGPRLPGGVPVAVAGTWMVTLYCSFIFTLFIQNIFTHTTSYVFFVFFYNQLQNESILFFIGASIVTVLFDLAVEPLAVAQKYWSWERENTYPSPLSSSLGRRWMGIPTINFLGWFFTALLSYMIAFDFGIFVTSKHFQFNNTEFIPITAIALPVLWGGAAMWYLSGSAQRVQLREVVWFSRIVGTIAILLYIYIVIAYFQTPPYWSSPSRM